MSTYRDVVRNKVLAEQQRQDDKWGVQNHDDLTWLAILTEEVGETAQAILKVGGEDPGVWQDSDIEGRACPGRRRRNDVAGGPRGARSPLLHSEGLFLLRARDRR